MAAASFLGDLEPKRDGARDSKEKNRNERGAVFYDFDSDVLERATKRAKRRENESVSVKE